MKTEFTFTRFIVVVLTFLIVLLVIVNVIFITSSCGPYYAAPGSNYAGECGAPDGVYEQGDWGSPDSVSFPHGGGWINNATSWSFAMCDHEGLGPLHGTWRVANGTEIPLWKTGVFPVDARLLIYIQNNTVVKAEVHSWMVYGD